MIKCSSVQQWKQQQIPPNMGLNCFEKFFDIWYPICKEIRYVQQTCLSNLNVNDFTHLQLILPYFAFSLFSRTSKTCCKGYEYIIFHKIFEAHTKFPEPCFENNALNAKQFLPEA